MQKMKRREFLKASVGAAAALATPRLIEKCAGKNASQAPSENKNAKVTAIRGDNLDSMTRDAIDALGGIQTSLVGICPEGSADRLGGLPVSTHTCDQKQNQQHDQDDRADNDRVSR